MNIFFTYYVINFLYCVYIYQKHVCCNNNFLIDKLILINGYSVSYELTISILRWNTLYFIKHNMKKDTEDSTFITRSIVHFNIINGVNCKN